MAVRLQNLVGTKKDPRRSRRTKLSMRDVRIGKRLIPPGKTALVDGPTYELYYTQIKTFLDAGILEVTASTAEELETFLNTTPPPAPVAKVAPVPEPVPEPEPIPEPVPEPIPEPEVVSVVVDEPVKIEETVVAKPPKASFFSREQKKTQEKAPKAVKKEAPKKEDIKDEGKKRTSRKRSKKSGNNI
tara:strand:- start:100 stop:660 length:561 start_codon:yes stop_codon:yes gene_type:complete